MLTVCIARGKRTRKLSVTGYVRPSGIKCAQVKNEDGVVYFVKILPNGTSSCFKRMRGKQSGRIVEVECKGHHFGKCCHVDAVKCTDLPTQKMVESGLEINALFLKNKELYQSGEWNEDGERTRVSDLVPHVEASHQFHQTDAYEQLAQTKADPCPHCGRLDEHYRLTGKCYWIPAYEQL